MKQRLAPGGELDLLTESELRKVIAEVMGGLTIEPAHVRDMQVRPTDGAGVVEWPLYQVQVGMSFTLTRLLVTADGFSAGSPFTGASASLQVKRNDELVDFRSLVAGAISPAGLPQLFTYGEDSGNWFGNGDQLVVRVVNGPASTNIVARFEGVLRPVVVGN